MDIFSEIVLNRWIYLGAYFFCFCGLTGIYNEILYFFFFADKSKKFRKKFKKEHNFLYRIFFGFVFNNEYMKMSRFYKYIVRCYIVYSLFVIIYSLLIVFSCFVNTTNQRQVEIFGLLMIILCIISVLNYMWYLLHSKKEAGFHWLIPVTWYKTRFYMDLPGCNVKGHIRKTGKE